MLIKHRTEIPAAEITPEAVYRERRHFMRQAAGTALVAVSGGLAGCGEGQGEVSAMGQRPPAKDTPTDYEHVTGYNNFYEFGTKKTDPAKHAHRLKTSPWEVAIEGEVNKPGVYALEDILKPHPTEERVYRLRCVEAWSMVIPWQGFPLGDLLKRFEPTADAKYVEFETRYDPDNMRGVHSPVIPWPYLEGLRMDEAMHPLTLIATGMYGKDLPKQNGAPLRLVVPWKYGFKSIKSIVAIRLRATQPPTSWNFMAPDEYGFYANVNPDVDHPRWSQARERRIGEFRKRDTLMFNGYAEQVAHLYQGMDLVKHF